MTTIKCPRCGSTRHTISFADPNKRRCKECSHLWPIADDTPDENGSTGDPR